MSIIKEIRDVISYFRASKAANDVTFYSEAGIYYQIFKGTIKAILDRSELKILYITSDLNDPVWRIEDRQFDVFYINKLLPFVFPFIKTKTLILTMADLERYHIKRSTNDVNHIYMFHAINSTHMTYNTGAFDHYDTIFCVGPHHEREISKTEEVYQLPAKTLIQVGYSWLEEIENNYRESASNVQDGKKKILIAPSWNNENILESCIDIILEKSLPLGHDIILRPHPEYIKREKQVLDLLEEKYSGYSNFFLEMDSASAENIRESSLLITDWSGIGIEYAWGMRKPVIYINTPMKVHNPDYKTIDMEPLEVMVRPLIGKILSLAECENIDTEISQSLAEVNKNSAQQEKLRDEHIYNWGHSAEVGADYIIDYCTSSQINEKD
jgi:YidC/Oxa1 family membrane protein insertase